MGFFDWMKAKSARKQPRGDTGFEVARQIAAPPRRGTRELLVAYREMPLLRLCVDTVAEGVANAEWCVYRRVDDTKLPKKDYTLLFGSQKTRAVRLKAMRQSGQIEDAPDHPALKLLSDPNDYLTGRAVMKLEEIHSALVGESYWAIARGALNVPVGLWPLAPSWVQRLPDMSMPANERTYTICVGRVIRQVPAVDVIAMRNHDPEDPLGRGVGTGFSVGDELDTDEYAARFTKNYFWNNSVPAAVVGIEGMNDATAPNVKAFKESLAREHKGPDSAGKVLFTNNKVHIARLDTNLRDMQFVDLRKFLMNFVRMTYRIPPEVIGDISNSNRATAFAAREILAEQVIVPRLEFLRTELQKRLMPLFGDDYILDYESPVPADRELELNVMKTMPEAFSYDEWRAVAGKQPDPERQGYPMPMPGQKPNEDQPVEEKPDEEPLPEVEPVGAEDPKWATQPLR